MCGRLSRDRMVSMVEVLLHKLPLRSVRVAMLVSGFGLELEGAVSMFWLKILGSPEVVSWLLAGAGVYKKQENI